MDTTTQTPAEANYSRYEGICEIAFKALSVERHPAVRAEMLAVLAVNDEHQSALHGSLYGLDPNPDEDGRPHAESLASSAVLLRALAETERALAAGRPRKPATDERVEEAGRHLLDDLAITSDPAKRAWLCNALCDAVESIVGGQAVERLYNQAHRYEDLSRPA